MESWTRAASGRRPVAALAMALGMLALLAPAGAFAFPGAPVKKLPRAKFKISVSGSQATTFSKNLPGCHGSSKEDVTFATPSPLKVTVAGIKAEGSEWPWFNFGTVPPDGFGDSAFVVNATVHRAQTWTSTSGCSTFADTRNCDVTIQADWRLSIQPNFFEHNIIGIATDLGGDVQADPLEDRCPQPVFRNTSGLLPYFPSLLSYDPETDEQVVKGPLSEKKLVFKKKKKKKKTLTSHAHGSDHLTSSGDGETSDTTTDWTVELKRKK